MEIFSTLANVMRRAASFVIQCVVSAVVCVKPFSQQLADRDEVPGKF